MLKNIVNNYKHLDKISKNQKVFLFSVDSDPVGGYGKLVKKLYNVYLKNNVVKIKGNGTKEDPYRIGIDE